MDAEWYELVVNGIIPAPLLQGDFNGFGAIPEGMEQFPMGIEREGIGPELTSDGQDGGWSRLNFLGFPSASKRFLAGRREKEKSLVSAFMGWCK